jgi:hypothetical protein
VSSTVTPLLTPITEAVAPAVIPLTTIRSPETAVPPDVVSVTPMAATPSPGFGTVRTSTTAPTRARTHAVAPSAKRTHRATFAIVTFAKVPVINRSSAPSAPRVPLAPVGPLPPAPLGSSTPSGLTLQSGSHVINAYGDRTTSFSLSAGPTRLGVNFAGPTSEYYLILITPD